MSLPMDPPRSPGGSGADPRLRRAYEAPGAAGAYARRRWLRARRTHRAEERILRAFLERVGRLERVLDVPCGAGRWLPLLAATGARVVGADLAGAMLREVSPEAGARLLQASARRLPFPDRSFDLVLCFRLLHHFEEAGDRRAVLQELARVCRGRVVLSYFDAASVQAWRHRLRRRRRARFPLPRRILRAELAAAGLVEEARRGVAPGWSEQVVLLLRRAGAGEAAA